MLGAEVRRYSTDRRGLTLNVFLGLASGAFGSVTETMLLPTLVLAFFVAPLTTSYVTVGLVPAIGIGVWLLARIPAAIITGRHRRKLPWAIGASLVKSAALALLALVSFRADASSTGPLLRSFLICYLAYSIAAGFGSVPISAVIGKSVPHEARGVFFQQRRVWSGVAAIVAGLGVVQLLSPFAPGFPQNFAILFLAATVAQLAATLSLATIKEPLRVAESRPAPVTTVIRALPEALTNANFRWFLVFRALLSASSLLDPFLVIFAASALGVGGGTVGWYVVALAASRVLSTPVWAALAHRYGERSCLQLAAFFRLLPPLVALVLPFVISSPQLTARLDQSATLPWLFGLTYVAIGISLAGQSRGNFGYLTSLGNTRAQVAYTGITNLVLVVVAFAPLVGGIIVAERGYNALLLVASGLALLAVFTSGALSDTHIRSGRAIRSSGRRVALPGREDPAPRLR